MTTTFWILTIGLLGIAIFVIYKIKKYKTQPAKVLGYGFLTLLTVAYLINLYHRPYLYNSSITVEKYQTLDTFMIKKITIISKNKEDLSYNKPITNESLSVAKILCDCLRNAKKFVTSESPKIYKLFKCRLILNNGDTLFFPIKISAVYGSFVEIYEQGGSVNEHLGDYQTDSLKIFLSKFYFPEEIDFQYKK